jgi:hypothetical protein
MSSPLQSFREFFNRKSVRLFLGFFCLTLATYSLMVLINQQSQNELLRGVAGLLLWTGWAAVNFTFAFKYPVKGLNLLINAGLLIFLISYLMR